MKNRREEKQKFGWNRFLKSFQYSFQGLKFAFRYEQNMFVHLIVTVFVLLVGFYFDLTLFEWVAILFAVGLVVGAELLNTAIEATVDLITEEHRKNAKIAKDTASACVLVFALTAALVGFLIFIPKFIELLF